MFLLVALALGVGVLTWFRPMVGLALALNTAVFRPPLQSLLRSSFPSFPVSDFAYSAVFLVPTLGVLAWKLLAHAVRRGFWDAVFQNKLNVMDEGVIGLCVLLGLGCVGSEDPVPAYGIFFQYALLVVPFYVLGRAFPTVAENLDHEMKAFVKATMGLAVAAALIAVAANAGTMSLRAEWRLMTPGTNAIPFAMLMGTALLMGSWCLLVWRESQCGSRVAIAVCMVLLALCLAAAKTRSALLSLAGGLVFLVAASRYRYSGEEFPRKWFAGAALALFLTLVAPAVAPDLMEKLSSLFPGVISGTFSTEERIFYYQGAFAMFLHAPVWGAGTGATTLYLGGYSHNIFLEIASEQGAIGLLALIFFVGGICFCCAAAVRKHSSAFLLLFASLALFYLISAQFTMTLAHLKHLSFSAGLAGFLTAREGKPLPGFLETVSLVCAHRLPGRPDQRTTIFLAAGILCLALIAFLLSCRDIRRSGVRELFFQRWTTSLASEPHYARRTLAARALARFPDPRTVDALIRALADEAGYVKVAAIKSLAILRDPKGYVPVKELLQGLPANVSADPEVAHALVQLKEAYDQSHR